MTISENLHGTAERSRPPMGKTEVLALLRDERLTREINEMSDRGYDVSVGETDDLAYEKPLRIWEVYGDLMGKGREYDQQTRGVLLGSATLGTFAEYSPYAPRLLRRHVREVREAAREKLLYGLPEVDALPWHQQGGKALALGTIVDAHDLSTVAGNDGLLPTMSGNLDASILHHRFNGKRCSANIAGLELRDASVVVARNLEGKSFESAVASFRRSRGKLESFVNAPVKEGFKDIVQYCTDSLGIRSRKEEVRAEISRHVDELDEDRTVRMLSVGCGTAQPMLEVMQDLRKGGRKSELILIDQDPIALAAAEQLARKMGLEEAVEIHCAKLFMKKPGTRAKVMDIQTVLKGRELDVCEDSGLREYFPDDMYEDLTRQAWNALTDDGIMTTGNMNKNRPQAEFLHGLMGWPIPVRMRHMKEVARLHEKAGVPKTASRYRVTQDGVYTLCFSSKQSA